MATKDAFTAHLGQMRQVELQELAKKRLKAQSTANVDADSSSLYEIVAPHVEVSPFASQYLDDYRPRSLPFSYTLATHLRLIFFSMLFLYSLPV